MKNGIYIVLYYMTNVKISKRGMAVLRNKTARTAIAKALSERAHEAATDGVWVEIEGKKYLIKTASALTEEEIASMRKKTNLALKAVNIFLLYCRRFAFTKKYRV